MRTEWSWPAEGQKVQNGGAAGYEVVEVWRASSGITRCCWRIENEFVVKRYSHDDLRPLADEAAGQWTGRFNPAAL